MTCLSSTMRQEARVMGRLEMRGRRPAKERLATAARAWRSATCTESVNHTGSVCAGLPFRGPPGTE